MGFVVKDLLVGGEEAGGGGGGFAGAGVERPAGIACAGDLQADAVAFVEAVGGGPEVKFDFEGAVGLGFASIGGNAEDAVTEVGGDAVGGDIAQAGDEVSVGEGGADVEHGADGADDVQIVFEGRRGEGEDVRAGFDGALVFASGGGAETRPAGDRGGVRQIEMVGAGGVISPCRGAAQFRMGVEVVGGRGGRGRPGVQLAPFFYSHQKNFDRLFPQIVVVALEPGFVPVQPFSETFVGVAEVEVMPGANGEVGDVSGGAEDSIVLEQAAEGHVVPAAEEVSGGEDFGKTGAEVQGIPVRVGRVGVGEAVLEVIGFDADEKFVSLGEGFLQGFFEETILLSWIEPEEIFAEAFGG